METKFYIERCNDGAVLNHRDQWSDEFPEAQLFDTWRLAAIALRKSRVISIDPSDTAIKSTDEY